MTKLSILITHLPEREALLQRLILVLEPQRYQYSNEVEILVDATGRHQPTGTKRNNLIAQASGEYVQFIDNDDLVPDYYLEKTMAALEQNPDVVTSRGMYIENGTKQIPWTIKLGSQYRDEPGHFLRWPNHICPIRKSIAEKFKFLPKWLGEDFEWSDRLNKSGLLKTEVHIPDIMYYYHYVSAKPVNGR